MKVCSVCRRCYDNFDVSCIDEAHPPLSETHAGGREIVDGYSLDALLESSPRGEIFRAHQLATGASCIIRIIATSEKERERSIRDAKTAAAIFHPNIADVYEAGTLDSGQLYVVSEYPAGQTLRELLDKFRVPELLTSISILSQTAEALHTLHQNGITHNAIRPENLALVADADGQLLVRVQNIDYGGVGFRSIISNKFMIDSALDSLRYFAPEQCTGESAGPQTDVYSLGIVFYEMLAGAPPFDASTATALIHKQRNERPPDVRIANFQLRMLLTHTLLESLQKQPMYRPASADKFARQMRHMEQLATHVSTPPPAGAVPETISRPAVVTTPPPRPAPVVINVPEPAAVPAHSHESGVLFDEGVSMPVRRTEPAEVKAAVKDPVPERPTIIETEPAVRLNDRGRDSQVAETEPVGKPGLSFDPQVVEKEPVRGQAFLADSIVEPSPVVEPVRGAVSLSKPIADPVPFSPAEHVRETVSLADAIPDPVAVVEPEPVHETVSLADSIPDPLPIVESKPGPKPASSPKRARRQAHALTDSIADPLPVVAPGPVSLVEPEMPAGTPSADLAREESNRTPRRSRLKTWKKKLHAMSSAVSKTPNVEKSAMVIETPDIKTNDARPEISSLGSPLTEGVAPITSEPTPEPAAARAMSVVAAADQPRSASASHVKAPANSSRIELTTLELPPEMIEAQPSSEAAPHATNTPAQTPPPEAKAAAPHEREITKVETRQTTLADAPARRKAAKRSAAATRNAAAEAPVKRDAPPPPPRSNKAEAILPDKVVKPAPRQPASVAEIPAPPVASEPVTFDPPRLVVEERVVQATPKKIQWDQPDDDIPSESEVLDVLVKDGVIDESAKYTGRVFTVTSPKSADGPMVATPPVPNQSPAVVAPKSADGPVRPAPPQNPARTKSEKRPAAVAKKPVLDADAKPSDASRKPTATQAKPKADAPVVPPVRPSVIDQEEITLVRPPRQIRIDLEQRVRRTAWTPPSPAPESDFFPTLLGEREKPRHIQAAPTEAMFSTYYSAPVKKTPIPYRTVMFGGGVLVLVVTFLIGDGFVGDHVQSKNESVASKTTTAPRAKKVPPIGVKSPEKAPVEESVVNENDLKPLPDNDRLTRTATDKPSTIERTAAVRKDTPKSASRDNSPAPRPVAKPAPTPSQTAREPVQQTRVIGVKSSPPRTNPNIATRPRIVKEPK